MLRGRRLHFWLTSLVCAIARPCIAQQSVDPITRSDFETHCDLLDLTDDLQRERADAAFDQYQREWQDVLNMQRDVLAHTSSQNPWAWRGWDQELWNRAILLFPHEEFMARVILIDVDGRYFTRISAAAPWATDMIDLLALSRTRQRCHDISDSHYAMGTALGHFNPIAILIDLDIPLHRGTALWQVLNDYANEFRRRTRELELATARRFRSKEHQRAVNAVSSAARSKPLAQSRDEIDAVAKIRSESTRLAHELRSRALTHLQRIAEALPDTDAARFRDRAMHDLYPALLEDDRDLTRVVARMKQRHDLTPDVERRLDEIIKGFRVARDHTCGQFEPVLRRATSYQRVLNMWKAAEERHWTREYESDNGPDMDVQAAVDAWDEQLQDWRARIEQATGLACADYGDAAPQQRWTMEDSFNTDSAGMDEVSRDVIHADQLEEIASDLHLDDTTANLVAQLIDDYQRSLHNVNDTMRQAYIDNNREVMSGHSEWYLHRYGLENDLIASVRAALRGEPLRTFTAKVRALRRTLAMRSLRDQRRGRWRFDLIQLLDESKLGERPELDPILDEYAKRMDEAIDHWGFTRARVNQRLIDFRAEGPLEGRRLEQWMAIWDEGVRTIDAIADINREYARLITGLLAGDAAWRFERAINGANLHQLGEPSPVDLVMMYFESANALDDAVKVELEQAFATYERRYAKLLDAFADHQAFWDLPEQVEQYNQRRVELMEARRTDRTVDYNAAGIGHPGMATLEQMLDLVIDTMAQLRSIIGDDVYNDLPPAIRFCFMCYDFKLPADK